jgi:hypothetical protein
MKSIRAKNVPGSGVGKKRYDLYFNGFRQIEKARRQGFYLECIAILESLNPDEPEKHRFSMLGNLTSKLKIEDKDLGIQGVYSEIAVWADKRNRAIHQMVKLGDEESTKTWEDRYAELEPTVEEGTELVERLSAKVKRLNQDDHKRRAKLNKD